MFAVVHAIDEPRDYDAQIIKQSLLVFTNVCTFIVIKILNKQSLM